MHDAARSADPAARLADARTAYAAARFRDALRLLDGIAPGTCEGWEEACVTRASVLVSLRRAPEAIAEITAARSGLSGPWLVRALTKLAMAYGAANDPRLAQATIEQARALHTHDASIVSEIGYAAGVIAWMERDLSRARGALREAFADPSPARMARAYQLRAWLRAAQGRYRDQLRDLFLALECLERAPFQGFDTAHTVWTLASLGHNLFNRQAIDAVTPYLEHDFWTEELSEHRFHAFRHVAWFHVLDGDELGGARLFRRAAAIAPAQVWKLRILVDRSLLARYLDEKLWCEEELWEAHDVAGRIAWESCDGEEILILASMAELFAKVDPAQAEAYIARYSKLVSSISPVMSARDDVADRAAADHAHGMALAALGQRAEAERLLLGAWNAFESARLRWRAALTALALHELTGDAQWLTNAAKRARAVRWSWIAWEIAARKRKARA